METSTGVDKPVDVLPSRWMANAERKRCCVYCGTPIKGGYACRAHSDLPALDLPRIHTRKLSGNEAA